MLDMTIIRKILLQFLKMADGFRFPHVLVSAAIKFLRLSVLSGLSRASEIG